VDERGRGYVTVDLEKPIPPDAVRVGWTADGQLEVGVGVYLFGVRLFEVRRLVSRPKTRALFNYLLDHLAAEEPEKLHELRDWLNENVKD
jgi:hypothetical protein